VTLPEYIASNLRKPFEWGRLDCVLFAATWAEHVSGINYLEGVPKWSSAKQGMRMVKEMGGLESLIDARLRRINPNAAKDGDIALHKGRVLIFSGAHIVGPGSDGLTYLNRLEAACAWSY
jgi:hypothetical protein